MNPLEAEALGQPTLTVRYSGQAFELASDVDDWPLELLVASLGVDAEQRVKVNHLNLVAAMRTLLGEQWPLFKQRFPKLGSVVAAAQTFATAAGFPRRTGHGHQQLDEYFDQLGQTFGAIPPLLTLLEMWPDKVESDLNRFWGLDYRDRWRRDPDGRRLLTLRQINARLTNLPTNSALAAALGKFSVTDLVLMDVYEGITRSPHPARPLTKDQVAERRRAQADAVAYQKAKEQHQRRQQHRRASTAVDTARQNAAQSRKA